MLKGLPMRSIPQARKLKEAALNRTVSGDVIEGLCDPADRARQAHKHRFCLKASFIGAKVIVTSRQTLRSANQLRHSSHAIGCGSVHPSKS